MLDRMAELFEVPVSVLLGGGLEVEGGSRQMAQPTCRDLLICNEVGIYIEFSYTHVLSFRLAKLNDIDL